MTTSFTEAELKLLKALHDYMSDKIDDEGFKIAVKELYSSSQIIQATLLISKELKNGME